MKGLVFVINRNNEKKSIKLSHNRFDLKYIIRRYGSVAFFAFILICGVTTGSVICNSISSNSLTKLDFFFMTNITNRIKTGAIGAFCASFASDFIFLISSFLMGYSLWGTFILPLIVIFKGFGIGISAGYLFLNYGFKGILFYICILLPGIFLVSMAIIYQSSASYNINKKMIGSLFRKDSYSFAPYAKIHLIQSFRYLLITLFASVIDMCLWCLFAGLFKF